MPEINLIEIIQIITEDRVFGLVFMTILGAMFGSYIGSVSYRIPQRLLGNNVSFPSSLAKEFYSNHSSRKPKKYSFVWFSICTKCYSRIPFYYNLPILGWILLKGRCAKCQQTIPLRYLLIELQTTVAFFLTAYFYPSSLQSILFLIFVLFSIALFWTDLEYYLLPDSLTIGLLIAGLLINLGDNLVDFSDAVLGSIWGFLSLWLINFLYKKLRHRDGMGYGDFKYLAAIGAWFGLNALAYIVFLASFLALLLCLMRICLIRLCLIFVNQYFIRRHLFGRFGRKLNRKPNGNKVEHYSLQTKMPFGVFLSIASSVYFIVIVL